MLTSRHGVISKHLTQDIINHAKVVFKRNQSIWGDKTFVLSNNFANWLNSNDFDIISSVAGWNRVEPQII